MAWQGSDRMGGSRGGGHRLGHPDSPSQPWPRFPQTTGALGSVLPAPHLTGRPSRDLLLRLRCPQQYSKGHRPPRHRKETEAHPTSLHNPPHALAGPTPSPQLLSLHTGPQAFTSAAGASSTLPAHCRRGPRMGKGPGAGSPGALPGHRGPPCSSSSSLAKGSACPNAPFLPPTCPCPPQHSMEEAPGRAGGQGLTKLAGSVGNHCVLESPI